jgi:hypothetical protein
VAEQPRFLDGVAYDGLGAGGEGDIAHGPHPAAGRHEFFHLAPDHLERKAELPQHRRGAAVAFANKAQEYMLGADGVVMEARRFLARN